MRPAGRVVFLTFGGARIGLGHVTRCLALAKALAAGEARINFVVSPDPGVTGVIEQAGFPVVEHPWHRGPAETFAVVRPLDPDTVVVDSYAAAPEHFEVLRPLVGQLVVIDDTAERRLPVDVVINVGAETEVLPYHVPAGTTLLLGSRYALLDPAFGDVPARRARNRVARVLVTLGGSVHDEALRAAVTALDAEFAGTRLDVVVGAFGSAASIEGATRPGRNRVVVHGHVPGLRPLMLEADLAVSGAGVTLYEIAATATPAVMLMTEPNQARNVAAFERAGAALYAGPASAPDMPARVQAAAARLAGEAALRASLGAAGRRLVDGEGARRVANVLASLPSPRR